ncbi:MAG: D-alanine--D-alanine ligase [Nitrospirota bacterium]
MSDRRQKTEDRYQTKTIKELKKKRIGVLMGGLSTEREVSLRTGMAIKDALNEMGYNVFAIDVGRNIAEVLIQNKIEVAFIALHGSFGENGAIQGLLEVMGIPYTGSGVLASALAMDKIASRKMFEYHRIPVPPFVVISRQSSVVSQKTLDYQLQTIDFPFPWVVKPAAEGSSIGVSIVSDEAELKSAMDTAFSFGEMAIIEKYIDGKEISVGILNDMALGSVEIRPKKGFYSYEAKYTAGKTEYILPPEVPEAVYRDILDIGLRAHRALGCSGATRVDTIVDKEWVTYMLEVNTLPGMTATSLLPKIALAAGIDFKSLVENILLGAIKGTPKKRKATP